MARARNIKPSFFMNEDLVTLPYEYRLLFIGLWTLADRDGLIEDRPIKIKMELFPADSININDGLNKLESLGFIERYTESNIKVISILNFKKHQSPHHSEKGSALPKKQDLQLDELKEEKATQEKDETITVDLPCTDGRNRPDSLNPDSLNPESLNLNPEDITQIENDSHKPKKTNRKTKLTDDFVIPDDWISLGVELRPDYSEQQVKDSAFRFKNYHISKGNAMASWIAAWRNWITNRFVKADNIRQFPERKQSMQSNVGQVDYYAGTTIGPNGEVFF